MNNRIDFPLYDKMMDKKLKEGLSYQLKLIKNKKNIKYIYNINAKSKYR